MLDEIFLSYVVLYLRDKLHMGTGLIALIVTLQMLASLAGLFWLEHLLKHRHPSIRSTTRLLALLCILTLGGVVTLLFSRTLPLTIIALLVISASCTGWYPLAKGEAYASKPDHAAMVNAVISLGAPFEMLLPAAIGLISVNVGIIGGLAVLGTAPILMLIVLPYQHSRKT
jgi:hypothetical protein